MLWRFALSSRSIPWVRGAKLLLELNTDDSVSLDELSRPPHETLLVVLWLRLVLK